MAEVDTFEMHEFEIFEDDDEGRLIDERHESAAINKPLPVFRIKDVNQVVSGAGNRVHMRFPALAFPFFCFVFYFSTTTRKTEEK